MCAAEFKFEMKFELLLVIMQGPRYVISMSVCMRGVDCIADMAARKAGRIKSWVPVGKQKVQ